MKKILVPTDFSEIANKGVLQAAKLAKKLNASLTILHCLDLANQYSAPGNGTTYLNSFSNFFSELKNDTEARLQEMRNTYKNEIDVQAIYLEGNPKFQIAEYANENWFDLIVMGTEGDDGISEVLFGSVAEKVVRRSLTPVLSIGKSIEEINFDNISLVADFKENDHEGYFKIIETLRMLSKKIFLTRINTPYSFENTNVTKQLMTDFATKYDLQNVEKVEFNHDRFEMGVYQSAKENNIGIVAIGTHGRSGISHIFKSSIAEDVVNHLDTPILTFNIQ